MKKKKDEHAVELGERLRKVINAYFSTVKNFAEKFDFNRSQVSSYLNGTIPITDAFATKLQDKANINKDYLLNGNLPMLLEDKKPLREHIVKQVYQQQSGLPIKPQSSSFDFNRSFAQHYILFGVAGKEYLEPKGTADIVTLAFDGIVKPFIVSVMSEYFCQKYNIPVGSDLIINERYDDESVLLVLNNHKFFICEFVDGVLLDTINDKQIIITETTKIIGQIYTRLERVMKK
ncbi:MAG: helix-turn-helix domain-containing protein [Firmicutes bacterium]|nr:helix-turn-helix domain-containing protein [Bacillota bacterium]